jgi:hypothetical protein
MGGERASTTRMRLAGKICCFCGVSLHAPYPGHERACPKCGPPLANCRLYMRFERFHGWRVSFRDLQNPGYKFRELTFASSEKLDELVERTGTRMLLEDRQAFELGIRNGLGAVHLTLTGEQYRKLLL